MGANQLLGNEQFYDRVPARVHHRNVRAELLIYGEKATFCDCLWPVEAKISALPRRLGGAPFVPPKPRLPPGDNVVFRTALTAPPCPRTLRHRPRLAWLFR